MTMPDPAAEWLEPDGAGGFASGTAGLVRTRCYHGLLLVAVTPPTGRVVLVNGIEAWLDTETGPVTLTSQRYQPGVIHPDGADRLIAFAANPWPAWTYDLPGGGRLVHDVFVAVGSGQTSLRWSLTGGGAATLRVRLLLSGRSYHALHHENPAFRFDPVDQGLEKVTWQPYPGLPAISAHGGSYRHDPVWFRRFLYSEEQARGLASEEDLASPGILSFDLAAGDATLALRADRGPAWPVADLAMQERRRRDAELPLHRSALRHMATRGDGCTVIAGFPWFSDWGRDTFIALRGILLATGRHALACSVLLPGRSWWTAGCCRTGSRMTTAHRNTTRLTRRYGSLLRWASCWPPIRRPAGMPGGCARRVLPSWTAMPGARGSASGSTATG